jgi:putative ABC transport system substrate-binding protein
MTFRPAALIVTLVLLIMPPAAGAQPAARMPRIGILSPAPPAAVTGSPFDAFREALRELGYVEGKTIALEYRFAAGKYERLPELAADLVRLQVDVIVTDGGETAARAALNATRTIPIVMGTTSADPVASGLVASFARPGGNVTGFTLTHVELAGKRLQLLKEMVPAVTRVAVLWDPETGLPQFRVAEAAARSLGVQLVSLPVGGPADLDAAFEAASRQRAGALLQLSARRMFDHRRAIVERALKHRLPGLFELGFEATGALASYGPSVSDNFRRAAVYVDKILKGTRPGDLPVEQPAKFYLVINLRTARALGVTIPPSVLLQATRIIE